uniref:Uncharacterized protein n=1 Tax=Aegilops tauschii subsp. strangulata TaxID=200361 RepID=A0A453MQS3_AEGTS
MPAKHPSSYDSEISNLQVDLFIHKFSECLNLDISANNKFLFTIGSPSSQVLEWQEVFNKDQTNKIYSDNQTTPSQVMMCPRTGGHDLAHQQPPH